MRSAQVLRPGRHRPFGPTRWLTGRPLTSPSSLRQQPASWHRRIPASDTQKRIHLPIGNPRMAHRLMTAASIAAEQGTARQLDQVVFAGRAGFRTVPADDSERRNALHSARQVEHSFKGMDDRVTSGRHRESRRGGEALSCPSDRDGLVIRMHRNDQDARRLRDPSSCRSGRSACHCPCARSTTLPCPCCSGSRGQPLRAAGPSDAVIPGRPDACCCRHRWHRR